MKKLTTKLMISVLSVALAFIALGTSTFAWFSMNTEVTASGMELTAATPVNLLISPTGAESTWKNSAVADESTGYTGKLLPASSMQGVITTFNAIESNQSLDNAAAGDSLGGAVTTDGLNKNIKFLATGVSAVSTEDGYFLEYDYFLKLSEDVANTYAYLSKLTVNAYEEYTVTEANVTAKDSIANGKFGGEGTAYYIDTTCTTLIAADNLPDAGKKVYSKAANQNLTNAVRAALWKGDTASGTLIGVYALNGADNDYMVVDGTLDLHDVPTAEDLHQKQASANKNLGGYFIAADASGTFAAPTAETEYVTAVSTTSQEVTLVVWIEGQDPACINANAGVKLAVSVEFKTWTKTA